MRVAFIADTYEIGGAFLAYKEMIATLKRDFDVEPVIIASKNGEYIRFAKENGYEYHILRYYPFLMNAGSTFPRRVIRTVLRPYLWLRYIWGRKKAVKLAEDIDFDRIDLIHSNTNRIDIGAILATKYHKPHIWHLREYLVSDCNFFSLKHNFLEYMNRHSSVFIAISDGVKEQWFKYGLNRKKTVRIYDGVDAEVFSRRTELRKKPPFRLVITGFVSPFKGQWQVIEALGKMTREDRENYKLDIYGHGALEYILQLKRRVKELNLSENIRFMGYKDNLQEYLVNYDIGLVCTGLEGFGRVTVEYMMTGLCVVACNTGANSEIISNGVNGFLYEYGDIEKLKNCILGVTKDTAKMGEIAQSGRNKAYEKFSSQNNAYEIKRLYECISKK